MSGELHTCTGVLCSPTKYDHEILQIFVRVRMGRIFVLCMFHTGRPPMRQSRRHRACASRSTEGGIASFPMRDWTLYSASIWMRARCLILFAAPHTPRFRRRPYAFDTLTVVHLRSTPRSLPDRVLPAAPPGPAQAASGRAGRVRPRNQTSLAPVGTRPVSEKRRSAMSNLWARATSITRRIRPLLPAVRSTNNLESALSGDGATSATGSE